MFSTEDLATKELNVSSILKKLKEYLKKCKDGNPRFPSLEDLIQTIDKRDKSARENIKKIREICNTKYSNKGFFGHAALNRKMLLDKEIADLLTKDSIKREGKKPLILVTNRHDLSAEIIGDLYKARWDIELFFKWIKQNLKIKKFLGKSLNAVKIQLATALITYLLIWIFKDVTKDKRALYLILVWVKHHLDMRKRGYRTHAPPKYLFSTRCVYL